MVDFSNIYCFGAEQWRYATPEEKMDALREVEKQCAEEQGRPEREINYYDGPKGDHGFYDPDDPEKIHVNQNDLNLSSPHEVVDTVAHEGRHAYQHDCVNDRGNHPEISDHKRSQFAYGLACPINSDDDPVTYRQQPTEVDAREYASSVTANLAPVDSFAAPPDVQPERQALADEGLDAMPPDPSSKAGNAHSFEASADTALQQETTRQHGEAAISAERLAMLDDGQAAMPPPPPPAPEPSASQSEGMSI